MHHVNSDGMKRVLFIFPPKPDYSPFYLGEHRPPLGVGFLASALEQHGHQVLFEDLYVEPISIDQLRYKIRMIDPHWICITIPTVCYEPALRILNMIEEMRTVAKQSCAKLAVGGAHPTLLPETIPNFVDYIIQGEGEIALLNLIDEEKFIGEIRSPDETKPVIVYGKPVGNLDDLPSPAWHLFMDKPYNWHSGIHEVGIGIEPIFPLNTSRGCPFNCAFCSVAGIFGRKWRGWSAGRIINEIKQLIRHYGAKAIYFREDNFTVNKQRVIDFCNLLLKQNIDIKWICESRVDTVDKELLKLMYKAGCRWIYFGVESGSQKVLNDLKKGYTVSQIEDCFRWCREVGIKTYASMILGTPTETDEDIEQSEALLRRIRPDSSCNNGYIGLPASELYSYYRNHPELIDHIEPNYLIITKRYVELKRRGLIV
jgi:radical SAM superfamily enzyme YgiQ (UPF0313 family)